MIKLENVVKEYKSRNGKHVILDRLNFEVNYGDHLGILGRNGSGKSTLIRIISGQETPNLGFVKREMSVSWPLAFSGCFQGSLTGYDNLKFISRIYGVDFNAIKGYVEDFSELGSYMREPVKTYSSGMQARLAFALSLAIEFDCYLIDEVVAVGDARFHEKCRHELFEKRKERAFIIVSHEPSFIRTYCNKVAVLEKGQLSNFNNMDEAYDYYTYQVLGLENTI